MCVCVYVCVCECVCVHVIVTSREACNMGPQLTCCMLHWRGPIEALQVTACVIYAGIPYTQVF